MGKSLDPSTAAIVNGTIISKADYDKQVAQARVHFAKKPGFDAISEAGQQALQQFDEQVLGWMIDQVLIEQAAMKQGITISEKEIDDHIARMEDQGETHFREWLSANALTVESLREQIRLDLITAAIRDHVTESLSRQVRQVHVRHILLSEESRAQTALQQLEQGENFILTARQFSEDETTRASGGELGFLPKGVMPPAFEEVAFSLEAGQISDVIHTKSGLHIVQVVEVDPERPVPDRFWPMLQQKAFEDWLVRQRAEASIQRNIHSQ